MLGVIYRSTNGTTDNQMKIPSRAISSFALRPPIIRACRRARTGTNPVSTQHRFLGFLAEIVCPDEEDENKRQSRESHVLDQIVRLIVPIQKL